ncbi:MAG: 3,5-cyclic-AMP phosphodiesterase [Acidimicrobiaceae bacterium]|nr:3,5-cyclic-AMP phosphodiesterase [Acidimicrobiaceae bacterium]
MGPPVGCPPGAALAAISLEGGENVALELTTVSDDEAVFFDGPERTALTALNPDTAYTHEGIEFRTLSRPPGERLATITTVNDLHFGETECGRLDIPGLEIGPVLRREPGEDPYPDVMNRAAVAEMAAVSPDAVIAKGDLTDASRPDEMDDFIDLYEGAFGARLWWVRGNHDTGFETAGPRQVQLPGVTLAIVDTAVDGLASGRLDFGQLRWLDQVGADADRPVLVFGHHHCWKPGSRARPDTYFGLHPDDSEELVAVFARRPALVGYFAGHTHRNRVRRFPETGDVPWVEVACVKDFPGTWAEYRVFEGGILQISHRISTPDALAWSERCRTMAFGYYPAYAFGQLSDRCFPVSNGG